MKRLSVKDSPRVSLAGNQQTEVIEDLAEILKKGVDAYEIFYSAQDGLSIEAKDGAVDAFKVSSNAGIGLRVFRDKRAGFAFTSTLSKISLDELVKNAVSASKGAEPDEFLSLPSPQKERAKELMLVDPSLNRVYEEEKIEKAINLERAARGFDPRVTKVRSALYHESSFTSRIVNSLRVDVKHSATFVTSTLMAVAESGGDSQMGWEMGLSHFAKDVDVIKIGRGAAKRAVDMLGAQPIKTIKCPVVIENIIVGEFLEILAPSFHADNLNKGKSMLKGRKGQKISHERVTLYDDGLLPNGWGTSPFDGEGVPRHKTCLIDKGVYINSLYDTYWAKREGTDSTGNAMRSNYKSVSTIGISNLYMEKGKMGLEDLLSSMNNGLFITNILGAHTANPITGDFSFGASGFRIQGGKMSYPVRGAAISGNMLELFSNITVVGADLRFLGRVGAPSILVGEMNISGTE